MTERAVRLYRLFASQYRPRAPVLSSNPIMIVFSAAYVQRRIVTNFELHPFGGLSSAAQFRVQGVLPNFSLSTTPHLDMQLRVTRGARDRVDSTIPFSLSHDTRFSFRDARLRA
jgi:hypothetical protein